MPSPTCYIQYGEYVCQLNLKNDARYFVLRLEVMQCKKHSQTSLNDSWRLLATEGKVTVTEMGTGNDVKKLIKVYLYANEKQASLAMGMRDCGMCCFLTMKHLFFLSLKIAVHELVNNNCCSLTQYRIFFIPFQMLQSIK